MANLSELLEAREMPITDSEDRADDERSGDTCWTAMKSVWDRIREHCGTGASINIGPVAIDIPPSIVYIASQEGSEAVTIETIIDTEWCKETAERIYSSLSLFDHGSSSYLLGLANVERTIAEHVVDKLGQE